MNSVPLETARETLDELVRRAGEGEPTQITIGGKPVARISAEPMPREPRSSIPEPSGEPFNWEELRRLTDSMPLYPEPPEGWVRAMRDQERY